jgi:hypothetical protein
MNTTTGTKPKALIVISSARQLPLAAPASVPSISIGFFLLELAQVLKEFENDYEFTFATPDGNPPQLDINGMSLASHAAGKLGPGHRGPTIGQRRRSFDTGDFRRRHAGLVQRREQELRLLERHLGRLPVSEILPTSDREAAALRPELLRRLEPLPEQTFHSVESFVWRHRDPRGRPRRPAADPAAVMPRDCHRPVAFCVLCRFGTVIAFTLTHGSGKPSPAHSAAPGWYSTAACGCGSNATLLA